METTPQSMEHIFQETVKTELTHDLRDLSKVINTFYEKNGYSSEQRQQRQRCYGDKMSKAKTRSTQKIRKDENVEKIFVGSKREGVSTFSESDTDILEINHNIVCVDNNVNINELETQPMFFVERDNKSPGYCFLRLNQDFERKKLPIDIQRSLVDRSGSFLSSDSYMKTNTDVFFCSNSYLSETLDYKIADGPSIPKSVEKTVGGVSTMFDMDYVRAFPYHSVDLITEWCDRRKLSNSLSSQYIDHIKKLPMYVVPVGDHEADNSNLQFRISFIRAEQFLITHFNDVQTKAFIHLKHFSKVCLKPYCKHMTSYVMKNVMLWIVEKENELAEKEITISYLLRSIDVLIVCIKHRLLYNYMVEQRNMFKLKISDIEQSELIQVLDEVKFKLLENPMQVITFDGTRLQIFHGSIDVYDILDKIEINVIDKILTEDDLFYYYNNIFYNEHKLFVSIKWISVLLKYIIVYGRADIIELFNYVKGKTRKKRKKDETNVSSKTEVESKANTREETTETPIFTRTNYADNSNKSGETTETKTPKTNEETNDFNAKYGSIFQDQAGETENIEEQQYMLPGLSIFGGILSAIDSFLTFPGAEAVEDKDNWLEEQAVSCISCVVLCAYMNQPEFKDFCKTNIPDEYTVHKPLRYNKATPAHRRVNDFNLHHKQRDSLPYSSALAGLINEYHKSKASLLPCFFTILNGEALNLISGRSFVKSPLPIVYSPVNEKCHRKVNFQIYHQKHVSDWNHDNDLLEDHRHISENKCNMKQLYLPSVETHVTSENILSDGDVFVFDPEIIDFSRPYCPRSNGDVLEDSSIRLDSIYGYIFEQGMCSYSSNFKDDFDKMNHRSIYSNPSHDEYTVQVQPRYSKTMPAHRQINDCNLHCELDTLTDSPTIFGLINGNRNSKASSLSFRIITLNGEYVMDLSEESFETSSQPSVFTHFTSDERSFSKPIFNLAGNDTSSSASCNTSRYSDIINMEDAIMPDYNFNPVESNDPDLLYSSVALTTNDLNNNYSMSKSSLHDIAHRPLYNNYALPAYPQITGFNSCNQVSNGIQCVIL